MRLLLDSHAFLWSIEEPENLSNEAREAILDIRNEVYYSPVSAWELLIKVPKGGPPVPTDLADIARKQGFVELPIRMAHAMKTAELPSLHKDPFDRILIAQAQVEGMTIVTRDQTIRRYPVATLLA